MISRRSKGVRTVGKRGRIPKWMPDFEPINDVTMDILRWLIIADQEGWQRPKGLWLSCRVEEDGKPPVFYAVDNRGRELVANRFVNRWEAERWLHGEEDAMCLTIR